jgi:hypothetical protein
VHNLVASMSRRGNRHDNAVMERFFQLLKRERIRRKIYMDREEARRDVFDYIEMFYNPKREHGCANRLSPAEFERPYFGLQSTWSMGVRNYMRKNPNSRWSASLARGRSLARALISQTGPRASRAHAHYQGARPEAPLWQLLVCFLGADKKKGTVI